MKSLRLQIAHEVADLPEPYARAMYPVLLQAEKDLTAGLTEFLGTVEGEETWTARSLQNALSNVREAITAYRHVDGELIVQIKRGEEAAKQLAQEHLGRSLEKRGIGAPLPLQQIGALLDERVSRLKKSKLSTDIQMDLRRQLSLGLMRNETMFQTAMRVAQRGGSIWGKAILSKTLAENGALMAQRLNATYLYQAQRIVRTETLNAYNFTALEQAKGVAEDEPSTQVMWEGSLDSRICADCRAVNGEVVKPGETFSCGEKYPPLHANCRCTIITILK